MFWYSQSSSWKKKHASLEDKRKWWKRRRQRENDEKKLKNLVGGNIYINNDETNMEKNKRIRMGNVRAKT